MNACPSCGFKIDRFVEVTESGEPVNEDAVGVCVNCKELHGFTNEGVVVPLTAEQEKAPEIAFLRATVKSLLSGM